PAVSPRFPYTTLFRSGRAAGVPRQPPAAGGVHAPERRRHRLRPGARLPLAPPPRLPRPAAGPGWRRVQPARLRLAGAVRARRLRGRGDARAQGAGGRLRRAVRLAGRVGEALPLRAGLEAPQALAAVGPVTGI